MAQSNVYSLNVVGYVNKSFLNQNFVLTCNPLDQPTNSLKALFPAPPDNTQIWTWNDAQQKFDAEISGIVPTYSVGSGTWIPEQTLAPGKGFFVVGGDSSGSFTNTYVGNVKQGALSTFILGNQNFDAIGSQVPVSGTLTNVLAQYQSIAGDNDQVWTWNDAAQKFDAEITGQVPTWSASSSQWIPDTTINVAQGFFLVRANGDATYTRNFTVQ